MTKKYYEKSVKLPFLPELRLNSPYWQNVIIGILVGLTASLYVALNLLGAGGGKPNSAQTVQVVNATLCAVWFFSASFRGSVLNTVGPAMTACLGVLGYILYVGSLMYFDRTGKGVPHLCWSGDRDFCGVDIRYDGPETTGVPAAVYIVFMVLMGVGACAAFLIMAPAKVIRDDGTQSSNGRYRRCLPSPENFLVYGGSVNAYRNNLRTRRFLSFIAVVLQISAGYGLQKVLDHKKWKRRNRVFIGVAVVGIPLMAAWIWEIIGVRNYDRFNPPAQGSLWQYIILYFLGTLTNFPRKSANYADVFRGVLGAGEAICFGLDSISVPYIKEAGVIFCLYASGVLIFAYLAAFHIREEYFSGEEDVVIPKHVLAEHVLDGHTIAEVGVEEGIAGVSSAGGNEKEKMMMPSEKVAEASV
ncbi:hypothetical protein VTN00DRAFT_8403 [Thermoascus crustaceus]|uniref:uncharacterized protein n=1 Tax=Thermoascus crustaceus TaxID=5088 RepID=UPI0037441FFF